MIGHQSLQVLGQVETLLSLQGKILLKGIMTPTGVVEQMRGEGKAAGSVGGSEYPALFLVVSLGVTQVQQGRTVSCCWYPVPFLASASFQVTCCQPPAYP